MLFDKLLGLAERHVPAICPILKDCKLFDFPHVPQDVLPKSLSAETREFFAHYFALPFPRVAVEDKASVIIVWDTSADAVGLGATRFFIECMGIEPNPAMCDDARYKEEYEAHVKNRGGNLIANKPLAGTYIINMGEFALTSAMETQIVIEGRLFNSMAVNKKNGVVLTNMGMPKQDFELISRGALKNVKTVIEELMVFNGPDRFIVEKSPVRRKPNRKKLARSQDRERYVLLTPTEIRQRLAGSVESVEGRIPHDRRRHVRMYPDDPERWPNMHGKAKVIPATWVGPHEGVKGNTRYRICLDL